MADRSALVAIRRDTDCHIGERVKLKANSGRKKTVIKEGVLEKTYPSIFVVKIDVRSSSPRRVTYSYSDLLTETIEITLIDDDKRIACM